MNDEIPLRQGFVYTQRECPHRTKVVKVPNWVYPMCLVCGQYLELVSN